MTEEDSKQEIRRNLTIDKLLNKEIGSKVTISDSDLQNYYNQHKADFNLIEPRYVVAHILVTGQPMGQPVKARARPRMMRKREKRSMKPSIGWKAARTLPALQQSFQKILIPRAMAVSLGLCRNHS